MPAQQNDPRTSFQFARETGPARASRLPRERAVPSRGDVSPENNEPRRNPRQGNCTSDPAVPAPETASGHGMRRHVITIATTLGNGYLGSRIDEERSEMRYLV